MAKHKTLTPSNLKMVSLSLGGMEAYLKKIQDAGKDIDKIVTEAVKESADIPYKSIEEWTKKHELTGATKEGVFQSEVIREGNEFFVEVGINTIDSDNAWHAVFVEYGSPTQEADPGIRNAFHDNKNLIKKIQRKIMRKAGIE